VTAELRRDNSWAYSRVAGRAHTEYMRRLVAALLPLAVVAVTACSSSAAPQGTVPATGSDQPATSFVDWPMYHGSATHAGRFDHPAGSPLHRSWAKNLGAAVYGEPLVVGSTLVVATEGNRVFGLNARTGHKRWSVGLGAPQPQSGLPCGDIDPLGITGTPAYDASTGSVFVVAETLGGHHKLWALNVANGHRRWHRNLDVLPDRNRKAEQERSALLVENGRVVVTFGGLAGDCDNYVGYVTSTPVGGKGRTFHYAVPTAREAGMWSPAGPVLGENGHVYVASGNGAEVNGRFDKSDSVTELSPKKLHRLSIFAPSTWAEDNSQDLDLGSSSPAIVPAVHRMVIAGKRGTVYLLRPHLGGVGSDLAHLDGCGAFGGTAVAGRTVLMPCLFQNQIRALNVGASTIHWVWSAGNLYGSPIIAGNLVYVADRNSGNLVVLRLADGHTVQSIHAGDLTHFPSEVVDGGYVFVPTLTGVTAFHG
jgi:outer membrane protein assembly factor BamB